MSCHNLDRFDACGEDLGVSIPIENLADWAKRWFSPNDREVQLLNEERHWCDAAWARVLMYLEYYLPGYSMICAGKAEVDWPWHAVSKVTKSSTRGNYLY